MKRRSLTKANIDELAKEMPVLNETEQKSVIGGGENDCVFQCISYMASQLGCTFSASDIESTYTSMIRDRYKCTEKVAKDFIELMGVNSSDFEYLCDVAFSGGLLSGNAYDGCTFSGSIIGVGYSGHAMIFTDCVYDDCGNVIGYNYYDPQAVSGASSGYISINDVNFVYEASGCA
jgi:hypothetical protein